MIDIKKEVQVFEEELKAGKFKIDNLPNNDEDYYAVKSKRDLAAFNDYLNSDYFSSLKKEALK